MIANLFEIGAWVTAVLLLHESLATGTQARCGKYMNIISAVATVVIFIGAGFCYWNAKGLQQLAHALRTPPVVTAAAVRTKEFEKLPLPQRKDLSNRLAKSAFVSGGELGEVVTDSEHWIPYSPTEDDIEARDLQIRMIYEIDTRRQELAIRARLSKLHSEYFIISLIMAIFTGLGAGRLCSRDGRGRFQG